MHVVNVFMRTGYIECMPCWLLTNEMHQVSQLIFFLKTKCIKSRDWPALHFFLQKVSPLPRNKMNFSVHVVIFEKKWMSNCLCKLLFKSHILFSVFCPFRFLLTPDPKGHQAKGYSDGQSAARRPKSSGPKPEVCRQEPVTISPFLITSKFFFSILRLLFAHVSLKRVSCFLCP